MGSVTGRHSPVLPLLYCIIKPNKGFSEVVFSHLLLVVWAKLGTPSKGTKVTAVVVVPVRTDGNQVPEQALALTGVLRTGKAGYGLTVQKKHHQA